MKQRKGLRFLTGILLLLTPLAMLSMTSCTKANFSAFFTQLGKEVPLERVSYKVAKPEIDTTIIWYAPYRIFENRTKFERDSIFHSEEFNWQGLGDFLWQKYQERKLRREAEKEDLKSSSSINQSDMIKEALQSVMTKLQEIEELRHIDLYNRQEQAEQHNAFDLPAALVQLSRLEYPTDGGIGLYKQVECKINLHLLTHQYQATYQESTEQAEALKVYDLIDKVKSTLEFHRLAKVHGHLVPNSLQVDDDYTHIQKHTLVFECVLYSC